MKVKQTFCLEVSQVTRLAMLKEQTGASVAELIRRAIDHYLVCPRRQDASKPAA